MRTAESVFNKAPILGTDSQGLSELVLSGGRASLVTVQPKVSPPLSKVNLSQLGSVGQASGTILGKCRR